MSEHSSIAKRIAFVLMKLVSRVLPPARSEWEEAMRNELHHMEDDWRAVWWSAGCVVASYVERANRGSSSLASMVKKPSAFLPVAMSLLALGTVLVSVAAFGAVHETDEGAAAHIWQLLMAGQLPILGLFAIRWLPRAPKQTLIVLALQVGAALTAMAPVYYLNL